MNKIDPNTLFAIFEQGDEKIYKEHGQEEVLKNPYVLLGMVTRGVENYGLMDIMYSRQYPKEYKSVRKNVKLNYFNKLFSYLERIEGVSAFKNYKISVAFNLVEVYHSLDHMRKYFEDLEIYEKCAILKKYQNVVIKEFQDIKKLDKEKVGSLK